MCASVIVIVQECKRKKGQKFLSFFLNFCGPTTVKVMTRSSKAAVLSLLSLVMWAMVAHSTLVRNKLQTQSRSGLRALSASQIAAGLELLKEQKEVAEAGGEPKCFGLVSDLCKPCDFGGSDELCETTKKTRGSVR